MPKVTSIPSQKEYEKVLLDLQARYNKTLKDMDAKHQHEIASKQSHVVTTRHGGRGCKGGGTDCLAWVDKAAADWNNIYKPSYEGTLKGIKKEISDYQKDVKALQDAKDQAELDAAMKAQQKIMQENIRETFRIETEKMREEIRTMPKDEPLQILNEVQHIKPEIIETPEPKTDNSKYFIFGGIAIAALVLFLILRRRK